MQGTAVQNNKDQPRNPHKEAQKPPDQIQKMFGAGDKNPIPLQLHPKDWMSPSEVTAGISSDLE